jgi:hypothetical protein
MKIEPKKIQPTSKTQLKNKLRSKRSWTWTKQQGMSRRSGIGGKQLESHWLKAEKRKRRAKRRRSDFW